MAQRKVAQGSTRAPALRESKCTQVKKHVPLELSNEMGFRAEN